jgi:hypothetical protein
VTTLYTEEEREGDKEGEEKRGENECSRLPL